MKKGELKDLVEKLRAAGIEVVIQGIDGSLTPDLNKIRGDFHKLFLSKDDYKCDIVVCFDIITCDCIKTTHSNEQDIDKLYKINELNNATIFGKHWLRYNKNTKEYDYIFAVEFSYNNYQLYETIIYAMDSFEKFYDIVTCPDIKTSYRMIDAFCDHISIPPRKK